VSVGIATVAGVLVYTGSAEQLRESPAERGVVWDELVYVADQPGGFQLVDEVRTWPEVDAVGPLLFFTMGVEVGAERTPARVLAFGGGAHDIEPRVISGRAPEGDAELVLNPKLADALGVVAGDVVEVSLSSAGAPPEEAAVLDDAPTRAFEVVGTAAVPLGDGYFASAGALTIDGYRSLLPGALAAEAGSRVDFLAVDRADGATTGDVGLRLADVGIAHEPLAPADVEASLDQILSVDRTGTESVPDLLAWLMLLTGAGVLSYGLIISLGRSQRELAIVRAIGFDRRLVRHTSVWVGLAQATAALVVGVPLGVIVGRQAWFAYARSVGVAGIARVPVLELVALSAATLVFGVSVSWVAGRWLSRSAPAVALRTPD
jgi:hypothetical protein